MIAQSALNYIFISIITNNAQKQTILDSKVDLRTTKEDIMTELKESRSALIKEIEIATNSAIDLITETVKNHEGNPSEWDGKWGNGFRD